eukprot:7727648-Alexandrium_andersonii.AAC.1
MGRAAACPSPFGISTQARATPAALRRLRVGTVATPSPGAAATDASLTAEVASTVAGHLGALLRLATR